MSTSAWDWKEAHRICLHEARRVCGSGADAEDAAQDALVRAWRARHTCAAPGQPEAWMAAIARNAARTRRSGVHTRAAREPLSVDAREQADARAVDQLAALPERLTVQRALAQLSSADRKLLRLRYEEDLTQPEIAKLLGWPEGTVKVRLHRLRRRLAHELAPA